MRQSRVGEPAATAAWNFDTPRRRSSVKRLCPFCHCRQRYERNLRRIHASKFVSTRGVWQKPEIAAPSEEVWPQFFNQLPQADPSRPACHIPDLRLEFIEGFWHDAPLAPVIRDAEPQELALLRSRYRALRLVDLQPRLLGQEPAHRGHHPFTGAATANRP
jgi:hypothetical protein